MAPSGETVLVRDQFNRVWLIQPREAGEPRVVDPSLVERAVVYGGFDRVGRSFDNWDELDQERRARASIVTPATVVDRAALDAADVVEMLEVAARWAVAGQVARARHAVLALLGLPLAMADSAVHTRLIAFLREVSEPVSPFQSAPSTAAHRAARDRWTEVTGRAAA